MRYHLHRRAVLGVMVALLGLAAAAPAAFAQNPPEEVEYYATDALGSVRLVFTPAGQVLGRSDYLPFGETLNQNGTLPRQRFTGQERDGEAGMDYFHARNLLARTGRMNAPDPLFGDAKTNPQRWNRYAYVTNNPMRYSDPTGLLPRGGLEYNLPFPDSNLLKTTDVDGGEFGAMSGEEKEGYTESSSTEVFGGGADSPPADQKPPPPPGPSSSQPSTLSVTERQKVYAEVVKPMLRKLFRIPGAWEYGSTVCRNGSCYYAMPPYTDGNSSNVALRWCGPGETTIAFLHRHTSSDFPSGTLFYNDRSDLYLAGVTYPTYLFYMVGRSGSIYDFSAGYGKGPDDSLFK